MNLESKLEKQVCDYAKSKGFEVEKIGKEGRPDRMFIYKCSVFFIEFKAPNKPLRENQRVKIAKWRKNGAEVYIIDTLKDGIKIINNKIMWLG